MGYIRILEPGSALGMLRGLLVIAGSLVVFGCEGDTLYDAIPADVEPPEVMITSPVSGSQVLAGQRVPIQVTAEDPEGVSSITLRTTGVVSQTITLQYTPPQVSVVGDTAVVIPADASGTLQITATGLNTKGVEGSAPAVTLTVSNVDFTPPSVSLTVEAMPRMELGDEIRVTIRAFDNPAGAGIARTFLTAIVTNTARPDTFVVSRNQTFGAAPDSVGSVFSFSPPFVDPLNLPDTLHILFFGMAEDAEGNCGGSVSEEFTDAVACDTVLVEGTPTVIANAVTEAVQIIAVSGRTSLLPGEGILADLLVDTIRSRVYVSNLSGNRLNVLEAASGSWGPTVLVGAEPWGLAINADQDSLFVANSGGTSISFVNLNGTPREDVSRRLVTQNTPLFEISRERDPVTGWVKLDGIFIDFSDRPQFIAQDSQDRLLYSTRPTATAPQGTIRVVNEMPGWDFPEAKILLLTEDIVYDSSTVAIAHVDSVAIFDVASGSDLVEIYDHQPGFPSVQVNSGILPLDSALMVMSADPNSDILWGNGTWQRERLALEDTTFVTASGDRDWVAFGEGGTGATEAGMITLWDAQAAQIHSRLLVADLLNNASERVTGLHLNYDGTLGAARGRYGSYYWSNDLRLQGSVDSGVDGGAGAALHPDHPSYVQGTTTSDKTLAFVGQADFTVRILDTVHFTERGQLHIRDNIVGPLRVAPPLPTDNNGMGRNCVGADCVVLKLYAITDAGGVVTVDVRRRDIETLQ